MLTLFEAAFQSVNLFYTVLLLLIFIYWITVFIGLLDINAIDVDIDTDVEVDVDIDADIEVDADADVDADAEAGLNPVLAFLAFFNLGKVPFMIFMSFLALFMWTGSLLGNYYLSSSIAYFPLAWILPNLLISLSLTKFCTAPLKKIFEDEENEFKTNQDIVGKVGIATLSIDDSSTSQVRIPSQDGAPLLIRVKAAEGKEIQKGEQAIIVHYDEEKKYFLVEPFQ